MKTIGTILIVVALGIFYLLYFIAAPALSNTIPDGQFHYEFVVLSNLIIGWILGIILPVSIIVVGAMFIAEGKS